MKVMVIVQVKNSNEGLNLDMNLRILRMSPLPSAPNSSNLTLGTLSHANVCVWLFAVPPTFIV